MADLWRKYGKTHVALVGGAAEVVMRMYPHSTAANVASVVIAVLTVFGVYAAPHQPQPSKR